MIGRGHVANPTLSSLGTEFGLAPLLGKSLAVIGDARLGQQYRLSDGHRATAVDFR